LTFFKSLLSQTTCAATPRKRWYVAHIEADGRIIPDYMGKEVVADTNFGITQPLLVDELPTGLSTVGRADRSLEPIVGGYAQSPSESTLGVATATTVGFARLIPAWVPPFPPSPPPAPTPPPAPIVAPPPPPLAPESPESPPFLNLDEGELAGSIIGGAVHVDSP
jgi:hypothetical protein